MKKISIALMCVACIALVACGNKKTKSATDLAEEAEAKIEAQDSFSGDNFSQDAVKFWLKKQFALSFDDITPECKYNADAEGQNFYAVQNNVVAMFLDDDEFTVEERDALVTKVYNATRAIADNGINIYGWESKDVAEEANMEKSLQEVLDGGHNLFASHEWYILREGTYYCARVCADDHGERHSLKVQLSRGLQKSFSDSMQDVEKALEDKDVQKAIKEAVNE